MPRSNTATRMLPHPAIEDGNFSFPYGDYKVSHKPSENSSTEVILHHELEGEGTRFIQKLIEEDKAEFACLVSVPKTGYRQLHMSKTSEQKINWDLSVAGEPPQLEPVILYVDGNLQNGTWTEEHGVAELWLNQAIYIPKGARLARHRTLRPSSEIRHLLRAKCDDSMRQGTFTVSPNSNEGFYFSLIAAEDIYKFIQNPQGNSALRGSIVTHAVGECFHILKTDYGASDEGEDEGNKWERHPNLVALSKWLENEGLDRHWEDKGIVHHWSEDGFDAVRVATELYPIDSSTLEEDNE